MGLLSRFLGTSGPMSLPRISALGGEAQSFTGLDDPALADFLSRGRATAAGIGVSEQLALRNSTIYRAMSLIASSIGMLPIHLMRRLPSGDTEEARDHPLFRVLKDRPNGYQTPFEFKSFMQYAALADGNAFALIVRTGGKVTSLIPLKRGSVTRQLSDAWEPTFRYNRPGGGTVTLAATDVFHFRTPISIDGLNGVSLFTIAAEAIGIAAQAERSAARLFKHGTQVGGVLTSPNQLSDEAYARLQKSMEERYAGAENAQKSLILEEGLTYGQVAGSAKDNQHLETRKWEAEEASRFTGVPRPLLMFDETSWGSGIEQLGQFFVTYGLMCWFLAWEEAVARSCLTAVERPTLYAKFNEGALLRGSLKDQADFFAKALGAGGSQAWMTPDEVRGNFDQNKIAGGDALPARMAAKAPDAPKEPA